MKEAANVQVIGPAKCVAVDGRTLPVDVPPGLWLGLQALSWTPGKEWPGHEERSNGEGWSFKDFERIAPFVDAWKRAAAIDDERQSATRAAAEVEAHKRKVEELKAAAQYEADAPANAAAFNLAATDWHVIKAMEAQLHAVGALPAQFVETRNAWRKTLREHRAEAS